LVRFVLRVWRAGSCSRDKSDQDTIFRIGSFDRSSAEKFVVGKSDPAKDWYGMQSAKLSSTSVAAELTIAAAPRTVVFSLVQTSGKAYQLHVSFLVESASVPTFRVDINGKHGIFYLHPKLDYSNGDQWDSFYAAYSHADVEATIPRSYLRQGENTINRSSSTRFRTESSILRRIFIVVRDTSGSRSSTGYRCSKPVYRGL